MERKTATPITGPLGTRYVANMDVANPNPYTPEQFAVIGEIKNVPAGNSILRVGRTLSRTDHRWKQELHLVLTPDEREHLIGELMAHRPVHTYGGDPYASPYTGPNDTQLAWVYDGRLTTGTVHDLANWLWVVVTAGEDGPSAVYAVRNGRMIAVGWTTTSSEYDDDDWATVTVTVDLGGGAKAEAQYRIDGRA